MLLHVNAHKFHCYSKQSTNIHKHFILKVSKRAQTFELMLQLCAYLVM